MTPRAPRPVGRRSRFPAPFPAKETSRWPLTRQPEPAASYRDALHDMVAKTIGVDPSSFVL